MTTKIHQRTSRIAASRTRPATRRRSLTIPLSRCRSVPPEQNAGASRPAAAQVVHLDQRPRAHERSRVVVARHVEVEAGPVGARPPGIEQLGPVGFAFQTSVVADRAWQLRLESALLLVACNDHPAVAA